VSVDKANEFVETEIRPMDLLKNDQLMDVEQEIELRIFQLVIVEEVDQQTHLFLQVPVGPIR
jgi:hypothetical protein